MALARLSEEKINEIRNQADIVQVIGNYLPLTRKGKNYVATCPFHDDHSPSMSISPDKQIYKCFVCGAGGNVFTFVKDYEKISFIEAVIKVAELINYELDESEKRAGGVEADPQVAAIHKVLSAGINYMNYTLFTPVASMAKEILSRRGLNDELIRRFDIGYNPRNDALTHYLLQKKFNEADLVAANVSRVSANGIHDVFSHRIMIPIHDRNGNPVGFTARRIDEDDTSKYINTTDTPAFHKGNLVFNLHRAKQAIKEEKRVIVVEGAMDVIAYEKVGIHASVATLGTACTLTQLQQIRNLHVPVVVSYDGDEAGLNATYKFGKLAASIGLIVEVVDNELGLDPDEIIEAYGFEELFSLSKKTISWIDFLFRYLQKRYNLQNYSQRKEFAQEIAEQILLLKEDFEKRNYYQRLYEITQFDMSKEIKHEESRRIQTKIGLRVPISGILRAEYEILSAMLLSVQASNRFKEALGFLIDEDCNKLALYIIDYYRSYDVIQLADLYDYIHEEAVKDLLLQIGNWELAPQLYQEDVFMQSVLKIQSACFEDKIQKLTHEALLLSDPLAKAELMNDILRLKREKNELLNGSREE